MSLPQETVSIEVGFYAQLRRVAGVKRHIFDLPAESTVDQLLDKILGVYPALKPELLDEQGVLHGHVRLLINGHDLMHQPQPMQSQLKAGDKVSLFPAIGGGSKRENLNLYIMSFLDQERYN